MPLWQAHHAKVRGGSPSLHEYKPYPNPPALSVARGQIKCALCGMYENTPLHYTIVRMRDG